MPTSDAADSVKELSSIISELQRQKRQLLLKRANKVDYAGAAQLLGKCRRQVKRYVESGLLPVIDAGWRTKFFDVETVLAFKRQLQREGPRVGRPKGS